jgi:hypothetical protein
VDRGTVSNVANWNAVPLLPHIEKMLRDNTPVDALNLADLALFLESSQSRSYQAKLQQATVTAHGESSCVALHV